jgi:hypothetical protein
MEFKGTWFGVFLRYTWKNRSVTHVSFFVREPTQLQLQVTMCLYIINPRNKSESRIGSHTRLSYVWLGVETHLHSSEGIWL